MPNLFTLFPTPLYKVGLSQHEEFKKIYVPKLTELFKKEPDRKASWAEYCHTWQLDINDTDDDNFACIREELGSAVKQYCQFLNISSNCKMTGWFNVHDSTMYQEIHNHMPAIISGIYYIQFDKFKDSQVIFRNPSETFYGLMSGAKVPLQNPLLAPHSGFVDDFIIEEGDLILFPGSLNHLVPKAKQPHDQLRITFSFNIYPII